MAIFEPTSPLRVSQRPQISLFWYYSIIIWDWGWHKVYWDIGGMSGLISCEFTCSSTAGSWRGCWRLSSLFGSDHRETFFGKSPEVRQLWIFIPILPWRWIWKFCDQLIICQFELFLLSIVDLCLQINQSWFSKAVHTWLSWIIFVPLLARKWSPLAGTWFEKKLLSVVA